MRYKFVFFLLLIGFVLTTGCKREFYFDYKLIHYDTDISAMPFGNNRDMAYKAKNKISYKTANDTIYTSIYISSHAGCPGTKIIPNIERENDTLFLTIEITRGLIAPYCPVSEIQLNFKVKDDRFKEVYFIAKKIDHPY